MKLESLSIRNLRSLIGDHRFCLKPLTLVVGANSSGKSTFVRTLPLLRQSVETITRGPLLWYGNLVDFGVFKDAVSNNDESNNIEISFTISMHQSDYDTSMMHYYYPMLILLNDCEAKVSLVVAQDPATASTYTKQIRLTMEGHSIQIDAAPDGTVESFSLDGKKLVSATVELALKSGTHLFSLTPTPKSPNARGAIEADWTSVRITGAFPDKLLSHVDDLFHGKTKREKKSAFARWLGIGGIDQLSKNVIETGRITATSAERSRQYSNHPHWLKSLQGLLIADRTPQILFQISSFLTATFQSVSYIGPLRATAERFYRQQDLAVHEVDPQGANLAMFLMGLSSPERSEFSNWCHKRIGFKVEAKAVGAHVSITLSDARGGKEFNIADMGFGYSQLLPLLATIWRSITSKAAGKLSAARINRRIVTPTFSPEELPRIVVVEQPELHLHPQLQGRLAELLCSITSSEANPLTAVNLICETHSETIVNQIGKLVSERRVDASNIQVLVFEKDEEEGRTSIRVSTFDENGVLLNWPYGFFLPSDN